MTLRKVTSQMITDFQLEKTGCDFMGYTFININSLSFHHLKVSHKDCLKNGIGHGYTYNNGAILTMRTSHQYLHIIQQFDPDTFDFITKEMITENERRKLEIASLRRIRDALLYFEKEHCATQNSRGKYIIRRRYLSERIHL